MDCRRAQWRADDFWHIVVSEMDEAERARRREIIIEAREQNSAGQRDLDADIVERAFSRPIEHPMDRDLRELAERDQRWAQQREREASSAPAAASQDWEAWLHDRLIAERSFVLECVGQALGQALRKERAAARRELTSEVRSLRLELTEAGETIAELRKAIAASNRGSSAAEVIDLQPIARRN